MRATRTDDVTARRSFPETKSSFHERRWRLWPDMERYLERKVVPEALVRIVYFVALLSFLSRRAFGLFVSISQLVFTYIRGTSLYEDPSNSNLNLFYFDCGFL